MTDTARYIGNPKVHAIQQPSGIYFPTRTPFTPELIAAHDRGEITLGTYVTYIDKVRMMVWDVDAKEGTDIPTREAALAKAMQLKAEASHRGFDARVLFSGNKGYHVWVLLDEYENGEHVQRLAKDIAAVVGFHGEVNPKQAVVQDLGNLVKLPGGVHLKTGQRSRWLNQEPRPASHEVFEAVVAELPPPPPTHVRSYVGAGRYPCVDSIINDPPTQGERNNLAYHFAAHMKRAGLWGAPLAAALEAAVDCSEFDVDDLIDRLQGPACSQLGTDRHCPVGQCLKDELGRPSAAQLRNAPIGAVVRVEVTGKDGQTIEVAHPDGDGSFILNTEEGSDGD